MSATKKKKKPERKELMAAFMTDTLEAERFPVSVYKFCKEHNVSEADFYAHFGSLETLRKEIWTSFFAQTLELLQKEQAYEGYGNREKMLSFFFTFFELLGLNRSYVLFALGHHKGQMQEMEQLRGLRREMKTYARDLILEGNTEKTTRLTRHNPEVFSEGAWLQLLFLLRFWTRDGSPGFEKTDMAIEKSVNTIFDVFDNTPLERVLDFGKFLYKEHLS